MGSSPMRSSATSGSASAPGSPLPANTGLLATAPGATPDNLLGAASAFAPASSITSFADLRPGLGPLAATPAPDLASLASTSQELVSTRLADVQTPLLAAAEKDANRTVWQALTGNTPPGLLIVLGTLIVALVAAGNVRVWQRGRTAQQT